MLTSVQTLGTGVRVGAKGRWWNDDRRGERHTHEPVADREQKRVALGYLQEAWAEARLDGIDGDCLAQACLFAALAEFVSTYGEDAAATFAEGLGTAHPQRRILHRAAAAIGAASSSFILDRIDTGV